MFYEKQLIYFFWKIGKWYFIRIDNIAQSTIFFVINLVIVEIRHIHVLQNIPYSSYNNI